MPYPMSILIICFDAGLRSACGRTALIYGVLQILMLTIPLEKFSFSKRMLDVICD